MIDCPKCHNIPTTDGCAACQRFACGSCSTVVPWASGGADEYPDDCSGCWMSKSLARIEQDRDAALAEIDAPTLAQELDATLVTGAVLQEVAAERIRQRAKWGAQEHRDGTHPLGFGLGLKVLRLREAVAERLGTGSTWARILLEEVFEAVVEKDPARLRAELVQVAAVAVQWIEVIDRRARKGLDRPSPSGTSET